MIEQQLSQRRAPLGRGRSPVRILQRRGRRPRGLRAQGARPDPSPNPNPSPSPNPDPDPDPNTNTNPDPEPTLNPNPDPDPDPNVCKAVAEFVPELASHPMVTYRP